MLPLRPAAIPDRAPRAAHLGVASRPAPRTADRGWHVWLDSGILTVGSAVVPPSGFRFVDAAETVNRVFLFPRGPLWVHHPTRGSFVADATMVVGHDSCQQYASATAAQSVRCDWFGLAPEVLSELDVLAAGDRRASSVDQGACLARDYMLQRLAFLQATRGNLDDSLAAEETTVRVLGDILQRARRRPCLPSPRRGTSEAVVDRTRMILANHLHEGCTLGEIARQVARSRYNLCRTLRDVAGHPPHRYLTELRLRHSLEWLETESSGLAAIALDLGFSSHSHFTAAFHRAFGLLPSEFRRLAGADEPLVGALADGSRDPRPSASVRAWPRLVRTAPPPRR